MITFRQLDRAVAKLIAPLRRRVRLMIGRAVLQAITDTTQVQTIKAGLLSDEVHEDLERFQEYGFTSVPYEGGEAIVVFVGGNREHGVVIATDDRAKRPTGLDEGDVALYDSNGKRVHLDDSTGEVLLGTSPTIFVALADYVDSRLSDIQSKFDAHIHTTTATIGPSAVVGVISVPTSPIGALASVAASEVKAK